MKLKQIILFSVMLFGSHECFANKDETAKLPHAIALNLVQYGEMNIHAFGGRIIDGDDYWTALKYVGVHYWYPVSRSMHCRIGLNYGNNEKVTANNAFRPSTITTQIDGFHVDLGVQYSISRTNNFYSLVELNSFIGKSHSYLSNVALIDQQNNRPRELRQIGMGYGLGYTFPLTTHFSLNAESRIRVYAQQNSFGTSAIFNPISRFGLRYRFNQKK